MEISLRCLLAMCFVVACFAPARGMAKEESKIRLFMEKASGGPERGQLRSQLGPGVAILHVKVSHLAPGLEHILKGDGEEVARFTTNDAGNAELKIDLFATGGGATPTFDPRGKLVTVNDGVNDVLSAWVYADPADDPAHILIKELTSLEPDAGAAPAGSVLARYDLLPSGAARFLVALRGVVPGDYDVLVDGAPIANLTTNPGGNATVELRIRPGGGNGNSGGNGTGPGHKHKGPLTINPRSSQIEVQQAGATLFAGPMLAQIQGLGTCAAGSASADLMLDPAQTAGSGKAVLGVEAGCDVVFTVEVSDLAAGSFDLFVDGANVGAIVVPDSGNGRGDATVTFDENPDDPAEQPLTFAVATGSAVAIRQAGVTILSGMAP